MLKYALSVKQSLLFTDLSLVGCSKEYFKQALEIDYSFSECLIRGDDLFWNYDDDKVFDKVFLQNKSLNQAVSHFTASLSRITKNLEAVATGIIKLKKWNSKNRRELESLFNKYIDAYLLNMPFLFHFWNVENLLITQLKTDFREVGLKDDVLQQVLIPSKETYFSKERRSLEEIALYLQKNNKIKNKGIYDLINQHIKSFGFTSFVFQLGRPLDKETILGRINNLLNEDIVKRIKQNKIKEKEDKRIITNIMRQLLKFPQIHERVLLAQELMFWKNQRLDILNKSDVLVRPFFNVIAKSLGVTYEQLVYLKYEEILLWFKTENLPPKEEIQKRIQNFALLLKDNKITLFTDRNKYPKVRDEVKQLITTDTLKGSVAYRGKVTGIVRVVFSQQDLKLIKKDEILVTKMTRPEMIVGLERAAAFITDQGGMLSHAAILSREMKKPCIVGTKLATQIFKTGDLIEVDANNGIIRKLS